MDAVRFGIIEGLQRILEETIPEDLRDFIIAFRNYLQGQSSLIGTEPVRLFLKGEYKLRFGKYNGRLEEYRRLL